MQAPRKGFECIVKRLLIVPSSLDIEPGLVCEVCRYSAIIHCVSLRYLVAIVYDRAFPLSSQSRMDNEQGLLLIHCPLALCCYTT